MRLDWTTQSRAAETSTLPAGAMLARSDRLVLWARVESLGLGSIDVEFCAPRPHVCRLHRVNVKAGAWRKIILPLRYFFGSHAVPPAWEDVSRLRLSLVNYGAEYTVLVDAIELVAGAEPDAAYLSLRELRDIAFGGPTGYGPVRSAERKPFVVITNAQRVDVDDVLAAQGSMYSRLRRDIPSLPEPRRPVVLIIFGTEYEFQMFWERLATTYDVTTSNKYSHAGGASLMGIAAMYDQGLRVNRTTSMHETVHVLMQPTLGDVQNWLSEGMAVLYSSELTQREDRRKDLQDSLDEGPQGRMPFEMLLSGRDVPYKRYSQAAAVVEWLREERLGQEGFEDLLAYVRDAGSGDVRPFVRDHLGTWMWEMEKAWLTWARAHYDTRPAGGGGEQTH